MVRTLLVINTLLLLAVIGAMLYVWAFVPTPLFNEVKVSQPICAPVTVFVSPELSCNTPKVKRP
jgi:hypothetical protein